MLTGLFRCTPSWPPLDAMALNSLPLTLRVNGIYQNSRWNNSAATLATGGTVRVVPSPLIARYRNWIFMCAAKISPQSNRRFLRYTPGITVFGGIHGILRRARGGTGVAAHAANRRRVFNSDWRKRSVLSMDCTTSVSPHFDGGTLPPPEFRRHTCADHRRAMRRPGNRFCRARTMRVQFPYEPCPSPFALLPFRPTDDANARCVGSGGERKAQTFSACSSAFSIPLGKPVFAEPQMKRHQVLIHQAWQLPKCGNPCERSRVL